MKSLTSTDVVTDSSRPTLTTTNSNEVYSFRDQKHISVSLNPRLCKKGSNPTPCPHCIIITAIINRPSCDLMNTTPFLVVFGKFLANIKIPNFLI